MNRKALTLSNYKLILEVINDFRGIVDRMAVAMDYGFTISLRQVVCGHQAGTLHCCDNTYFVQLERAPNSNLNPMVASVEFDKDSSVKEDIDAIIELQPMKKVKHTSKFKTQNRQ
jgi:hypothetical protein